MRRYCLALSLAVLLPGAANAQPPSQQGDDQPPPAHERPRPPAPSYHEEVMAPPPPGGGYYDSYGTGDVRGAEPVATAPPPQGGARPHGPRDPAYARAHYAARIARWRALADACEAGDLAACRGTAN